MITKPRARRFRIRRAAPQIDPAPVSAVDDGFGPGRFPTAAPEEVVGQAEIADETELEAIRREGLTGRQLRLARRVAQKHGLAATSDYDAVRLLRRAGIDPFQRSAILELVTAAGAGGGNRGADGEGLPALAAGPDLPAHHPGAGLPSTRVRAQSPASEVERIQRDILRRRRRRLALLMARLGAFVMLPTFIAGWYFYVVATPLYATKSEFVIQQAEPQAAAGLRSMFSGTQFATAQDSMAVQGYLQSREAMQRLDRDVGFRVHFAGPQIDPILRLDPDASFEAAFKTYRSNVKISYDPTEGIIKMEVSAPSPELSEAWSKALIAYAEEQVDRMTQRLREQQMQDARSSFEDAEAKMQAAQARVVELQERFKVLSSEVEVGLITAQITALEGQLTQDRLSLAQMLSNPSPNRARVEPLQRRVATLESEIAALRARLTEGNADGASIARVQSELLVAEADVATRQLLLSQSLQQMESARIEANRQVRYLSVSVSPVAPDVATYPRAFENTAVAMLIFGGIYLMIAMTGSILREQVTS
ncbi:MAG: capsule biosynthesis protein [Gemmobacter sp.]